RAQSSRRRSGAHGRSWSLLPPWARARARRARDGAREVSALDGRAPVGFDVLDDELRAPGVADVRGLARVVHHVGQVTHQGHLEAQADHLPDAERSAQDAHVGADAHNDEILDALAAAVAEDFAAL